MKLSLVISTADAGFDALAFKGDLEDGIEMAREIGYEGVEIAVRDPSIVDVDDILKTLDEMKVPAIGTGQAFLVEGLSLTADDEKVREKAVERLKKQVDFAKKLDGMVIIGLIRGFVKKRNREKVLDMFVESTREVAKYAKEKNVKLVIEPLNRYESDFLNTAEETINIIKRIGMDNIGLLLDTYHMNIEERYIDDTIAFSKDLLFHFHVADSNRWAPGFGHIDFKKIFYTLEKINYEGFVSFEGLPMPGGPKDSAKLAYEYMKALSAVSNY